MRGNGMHSRSAEIAGSGCPNHHSMDRLKSGRLVPCGLRMFGPSLFLLRAVPPVFAAGSVYSTCLLVDELGGASYAQIISASREGKKREDHEHIVVRHEALGRFVKGNRKYACKGNDTGWNKHDLEDAA